MIKDIVKKIALVFLVLLLISPNLVFAQDSYGLDKAAGQAGIKQLAISKKTPFELVGDIIGVGLSLIGVVFFVLVLIAGIRWMTALGSPEKAEKAKSMLEAAIIGLVIVLGAYAIVNFVFSSLGVGGETGGSDTRQACERAGESCGDNSVCDSSLSCVSECEYTYVGVCGTRASCSFPDITISGQCPGGVDNICCYNPSNF